MGFFTKLAHALLDATASGNLISAMDDDKDSSNPQWVDGDDGYIAGASYGSVEIDESLASSLLSAFHPHPDSPMVARGQEICESFSEYEWIGFYT